MDKLTLLLNDLTFQIILFSLVFLTILVYGLIIRDKNETTHTKVKISIVVGAMMVAFGVLPAYHNLSEVDPEYYIKVSEMDCVSKNHNPIKMAKQYFNKWDEELLVLEYGYVSSENELCKEENEAEKTRQGKSQFQNKVKKAKEVILRHS